MTPLVTIQHYLQDPHYSGELFSVSVCELNKLNQTSYAKTQTGCLDKKKYYLIPSARKNGIKFEMNGTWYFTYTIFLNKKEI